VAKERKGVIKYIGSKRRLVPIIGRMVAALPDVSRACDLFTGTTRVAQQLKRDGLHVIANDLATYSEVFARAYIEADARDIDTARIERLLDQLHELTPVDGWFTQQCCRDARYFQPHNGMRIDAMRPAIDELARDGIEHAILLTSLIEAADRVDSTTGVQMAFLKQWAPRSHNDLELRVPELLDGEGTALRLDANELAATMPADEVDLVYVDPPYNQHKYYGNYHVWETLVRNDQPGTYGIANKRVDCRTTSSDYNSARRARDAFERLVNDVAAPYLLVSFSDEGFLDVDDIRAMLGERGYVGEVPVGDHRRYVGAQIGIHNLRGERVGEVSHVRNTEYMFLVGSDAAAVASAIGAATTAATAVQ
jgi:adenine-specific DNA-methyltransferase